MSSEMRVNFMGKQARGADGRFASALSNYWESYGDIWQQKVAIYGGDAAFEVAKELLALSNSRAPRETGALIESGKVIKNEGKIGARVVYDTRETNPSREDFNYAYEQHENMSYKHPNGGGPKYLESAYEDMRPQIMERLGKAVSAAVPKKGEV